MRNRFLAILIVQDLSILVVKRLLLSKKPIFLFAVEAFRCAVDSRLCTSMYSKYIYVLRRKIRDISI